MADDVIAPATPAAATPARPVAPPAPKHEHQFRVGFAYGVLAVALAGALAGLVVLVSRPKHHAAPQAAWSQWTPSPGDAATVTKQIAQHVQGEYKFKDGKALVAVITHKPTVGNNLPVSVVALRGQTGAPGQIVAQNADHAWMFELCGLGGAQCAITRGTPNLARGRLVRREALELALYTFKFAPEIDSVLALLPPKPPVTPQTPRYALYVRKSDLHAQLSHPLSATLTPQLPLSNTVQPQEAISVDGIVGNRVYQLTGVEQLQDLSVALVLDPPSVTGG